MSKSINLEQLCLQMNSMWQYMDIKLQGRLSSIMTGQKCPSYIMFISDQQLSYLANKTCTIYTVAKEFQDISTRCQYTLKTFFHNYTEKELSHAEKENIYWQIRLRYACGIIPVAVVHMISKLRECGYTNWILPNSMTVREFYKQKTSLRYAQVNTKIISFVGSSRRPSSNIILRNRK